MKTAVLDSGFAGSIQQTIPLVLEPARKTRAGESAQVRKPKRVVVSFSGLNPEFEVPDARIQVPKPGVLGWVELGFVMVLFVSAFVLVFLSVAAAGNL